MRRVGALVLAAVMLVFGCLVAVGGWKALENSASISPAFIGIAILWLVAGPAMLGGGMWLAASLGRSRAPLWIGGVAAVLSGGSLIAGVLTYVIPCSGPS